MRRVLLIITLVTVSDIATVSIVATLSGADQTCVNQGSDPRLFPTLVCGMQRELSWKSERLPHLFRVGSRRRTHVAIAWPPYVIVNRRAKDGNWIMFRVGFRYDRTWRGYIFPTAALKEIQYPILY